MIQIDDKDALVKQIIKMLENKDNQIEKKEIKSELDKLMQRYSIIKNTVQRQNNMPTAIDNFISAKRIDGLADTSLKFYKERLLKSSQFINKPINKISTENIRSYITHLIDEKNLKRTTISTDINILRNFFNWLFAEGKLKHNPCLKIKGIKIDKKGFRKALTPEELEKLKLACKTKREKAIIELLYSTGCRLSEIINTNVDDINFTERSISVIGKGNKKRIVYFSVKAKLLLEDYLNNSKRTDNSLFVTEIKPYKRMGRRTLQKTISALGKEAGINKAVHPHLLRHTFACSALNAGMDIIVIQKLLGHEDVSTTQIYADLNQNNVKQEYNKLIS